MISLLNKLGRRMVSDRGEKLNNPRLFSSTAKRVLSVLFLLILGFSFLPHFDINVSAAGGLTEVTYTIRSDGGIDITGTVTPAVIGGSVGQAYLFNTFMRSADGTYSTEMDATVMTQLSGNTNRRDVSTWRNTYYPPEDGDWYIQIRWFDSTTGQSQWLSHSDGFIRFNGLKYNRNGKRAPSMNTINVSPDAYDKTKINYYMSITRGGDRRPLTLSYWRGDANGNNGVIVYTKSYPNAMGNHNYSYTGLTAGTTYTFWHTITSMVGSTDGTTPVTYSTSKTVATPGTPSEPINFRAVPNSGSVTFTWDEPTNKNGATISGYNLYSNSVKQNSSLITNKSFSVGGTNGYALSITNFYVAAVTSEGKEGSKSAAINGNTILVGSPQPVANACCIMLNS